MSQIKSMRSGTLQFFSIWPPRQAIFWPSLVTGILLKHALRQKTYPLLGLLLIASPSALAGNSMRLERNYAVVSCPRVPPAFSQLLNDLSTLKSKITNDAHCTDISIKAGELEKLVASERRAKFLEIIRNNKDQIVSAEDADFLRQYAEDASSYSLKLMALISGNQSCFPDAQQGQGLNTLTTVVYEAASLLSQVAGPYGAPIAIGGDILTGVLRGIQAFRDSQPGYRFNDSKDRQAYAEQLCLYYSSRNQMDNLLHPEIHLAELARLRDYLEERLIDLGKNCAECAELQKLMPQKLPPNAAKKIEPQVDELRLSADGKYREALGSDTLELLESKFWAEQEIKRFLAESDPSTQQSIGPEEVLRLRDDLDHFFFELESPDFLSWQTQQAIQLDARFTGDIYRWLNPAVVSLAAKLRDSGAKWNDDGARLKYLVDKRASIDPESLAIYESKLLHDRDLFDEAWAAFTVIEEYCQFFVDARVVYSKINGLCNSATMASQKARLSPREHYTILGNPRHALEPEKYYSSGITPNLPALESPKPRKLASWVDALELNQDEWRQSHNKYLRRE